MTSEGLMEHYTVSSQDTLSGLATGDVITEFTDRFEL